MNKRKYESPVMTEVLVELEQGFLKASVFEPDGKENTGVDIAGHEIGGDLNFDNNDSLDGIDGWDKK